MFNAHYFCYLLIYFIVLMLKMFYSLLSILFVLPYISFICFTTTFFLLVSNRFTVYICTLLSACKAPVKDLNCTNLYERSYNNKM